MRFDDSIARRRQRLSLARRCGQRGRPFALAREIRNRSRAFLLHENLPQNALVEFAGVVRRHWFDSERYIHFNRLERARESFKHLRKFDAKSLSGASGSRVQSSAGLVVSLQPVAAATPAARVKTRVSIRVTRSPSSACDSGTCDAEIRDTPRSGLRQSRRLADNSRRILTKRNATPSGSVSLTCCTASNPNAA